MKKQKAKIFGKFFAAICVIVAIFCGGYFLLDKLVIPKYFGSYGIHSVPDLVEVVASLYKNPKESEIVTNAYTQNDFASAITILTRSNYCGILIACRILFWHSFSLEKSALTLCQSFEGDFVFLFLVLFHSSFCCFKSLTAFLRSTLVLCFLKLH